MLDDSQAILKQDHLQVIKSTQLLADQCQQAWEDTQNIHLPSHYSDINHVVVAGMGGSHLGAQLINSVFDHKLNLPLIIKHQYSPPGYVNEHTLVIATSVSGNTEETLTFVDQALQKKAKIICISSGGKLADFAKTNQLPAYIFDPKHNPSGIPRYGSGYLFISQLVFLSKVGAIALVKSDVDSIVSTLHHHMSQFGIDNPTDQNPAKQIATQINNHAVIIVASEHLVGSAYIFKNQLNESAKQFAALFSIPELNHHLLESLSHPKSNTDNLHFVFFGSNLYSAKNQKRFDITTDIIKKQGIATSTLKLQSQTQLAQAFEALALSSYIAIYSATLNQVDPGPNPWVDDLKQRLK